MLFSINLTTRVMINKTTNRAHLLKFRALAIKKNHVRNITSSIVQLFDVFENKREQLTKITNSCPIQ
jgi:hypothetical protein